MAAGTGFFSVTDYPAPPRRATPPPGRNPAPTGRKRRWRALAGLPGHRPAPGLRALPGRQRPSRTVLQRFLSSLSDANRTQEYILCRSTTFSTNCKPSPASRTAGYRAIPRCTWRSTTPPTPTARPPPSSRWPEGPTSPCWRAPCKRTTRAAPWSWAGRCGGRGTARPASARYRSCWIPSWPTSTSSWTRPCRNRCATWGPEADGRRVPRRGWRGSGVPVYGRFHPNRLK